MRNINLVIFTYFLLFCPLLLNAQKLHSIFFVATKDASLREMLPVSYEDLKKFEDDLRNFSGMEVISHHKTGMDFTLEKLDELLVNIELASDDAVVFWFAGHGFQDSERNTPNLLFVPVAPQDKADQVRNSRNLQEIYDHLDGKCRFLWVIADACNNNPVPHSKMGLANDPSTDMSIVNVSESNKIKENYQKLFRSKQSRYLFRSSRRGKPTIATQTKGALYSRAFLRIFSQEMQKEGIDDVKKFENQVKREYDSFLDLIKGQESKPGFFKKMLWFLFEGKENKDFRKTYKDVLQSGNLDELSLLLEKMDSSETNKTHFLSTRPLTYYFTQAVFNEYIAEDVQDSTEVGLCYCTAKEIINYGIPDEREFNLFSKIEKYDEGQNVLGIEDAGGRLAWLRKKCALYQDYLARRKGAINLTINALQVKRRSLEDSLSQIRQKQIALLMEVEEIQLEIDNNTEKITTIEKKWEEESVEVTYSIAKIPRNQQDRECLKTTVEKLENNEPLTENCEKVLAPFVQIERKLNDAKEVKAFRSSTAKGYALGEHCTPEIEQATSLYLQPLLAQIEKVPENYRSKLEVGLQVTGEADSKPCVSGCSFTAQETATFTYKNRDGEQQSFSVIKGKFYRISNEQLAFARALCAFNKAEDILKGMGVRQISNEFLAIVNEEAGDDFRGARIAFDLKNAFQHYKDQRDTLNTQNLLLRYRLEEKNAAIQQLEREMEGIEMGINQVSQEIDEKNELLFWIEDQIQKLQVNSPNIEDALVKILMAKGNSEKEAREHLKKFR